MSEFSHNLGTYLPISISLKQNYLNMRKYSWARVSENAQDYKQANEFYNYATKASK